MEWTVGQGDCRQGIATGCMAIGQQYTELGPLYEELSEGSNKGQCGMRT